ncbi:MAG: ATP-dependent sacrificial sulfur transferase LarE [Clostridia bacterium]|nr:ATP-dependent sacrificial sulfur transferase LarE [Clostridia bacterium]
MNLKDFFLENHSAVLGFSGGVDSVYLMYAAHQCGAEVIPCFVKTQFQPRFELEDAENAAAQIGVPLWIIEYDILKIREICENSSMRCYHCKSKILTLLLKIAEKENIPLVIDGTNASDKAEERPGMTALQELGIRSPLKECGITKEEIRSLSKKAGLFTFNKPSYSCLATRIMTGEQITAQELKRIENAENTLFNMGFSDFRVRVWHGAARLQFSVSDEETAFAKRAEIIKKLNPYFSDILFDLKGRGNYAEGTT